MIPQITVLKQSMRMQKVKAPRHQAKRPMQRGRILRLSEMALMLRVLEL
jgi:hypothetical protein